ncbi:hypothetical protein D8S78_17110 [Natrialba swarupiae]|nr:hypothetical protein [Natrialba swarupiae]
MKAIALPLECERCLNRFNDYYRIAPPTLSVVEIKPRSQISSYTVSSSVRPAHPDRFARGRRRPAVERRSGHFSRGYVWKRPVWRSVCRFLVG